MSFKLLSSQEETSIWTRRWWTCQRTGLGLEIFNEPPDGFQIWKVQFGIRWDSLSDGRLTGRRAVLQLLMFTGEWLWECPRRRRRLHALHGLKCCQISVTRYVIYMTWMWDPQLYEKLCMQTALAYSHVFYFPVVSFVEVLVAPAPSFLISIN